MAMFGQSEWEEGGDRESEWWEDAPQPQRLALWELTMSSPAAEFLVNTELRDSTAGPGSGLGRFTTVDLFEGQVLRSGPLVSVSTYLEGGLKSVGGITVTSGKDIEVLLQYWHGDRRRLADFLTGVRAKDTDQAAPVMYIASSSAFINHSVRANVRVVVQKGTCHILTTRPVGAGEELFLDYRLMYISSDVKLYFARFGLVDVQSLSVELDPPPANAALRELQPHEADMVNMVLSDYCKLQTEVYGLREVSKEKVLAVRLVIDRILTGSLPGKVLVANHSTAHLGSGIFFKTHHQAVSPQSSYAHEEHAYLWLHFFFAAKNARNIGLLTFYAEAGERFAKDSGCRQIRTDIVQHNIACASALKKLSFQPETTVWCKSAL